MIKHLKIKKLKKMFNNCILTLQLFPDFNSHLIDDIYFEKSLSGSKEGVYVYYEKGMYYYTYFEKGTVTTEKSTQNVEEVLYWLVDSIITSLSFSYEF